MFALRRFSVVLLTALCILSFQSCGNDVESQVLPDDDNAGEIVSQLDSIPEENILHTSSRTIELETIEAIYDYADYIVIGRVKSKGDSFLISGEELDTSKGQEAVMKQLIGLRTPYEIEVISSYKGDLSAGDSYTILNIQGVLDGYALDSGKPEYEVGDIYFLPISDAAPGESYAYSSAVAKIDVPVNVMAASTNITSVLSSQSSASVTPLGFETAYLNIDTLSELVSELEALQESNE